LGKFLSRKRLISSYSRIPTKNGNPGSHHQILQKKLTITLVKVDIKPGQNAIICMTQRNYLIGTYDIATFNPGVYVRKQAKAVSPSIAANTIQLL